MSQYFVRDLNKEKLINMTKSYHKSIKKCKQHNFHVHQIFTSYFLLLFVHIRYIIIENKNVNVPITINNTI